MSRQFNLLATDVDLAAIEISLRHLGNVRILSDTATENLNDLLPLMSLAIRPEEAGKHSLFCYLAPADMASAIELHRVSAVKIQIDEQHSDIIEFWRPFFDGRIIRAGRLYYQDKVYRAQQSFAKDPSFCRWANAVFAAIRRDLKLDSRYGAYVGDNASNGIASGQYVVESIL